MRPSSLPRPISTAWLGSLAEMKYYLEVKLGDRQNAKKLYDVEVRINRTEHLIEVYADSRDQAAEIAREAGYVINIINFVG